MAKRGKGGSGKKKDNAPPTTLNKTKKDKNVFKVPDAKSKKKPKLVQVKLKKMKEVVGNKREKVDATLKELHEDLVVQKEKPSKSVSQKGKKSKTPAASTTKVQQKLRKMQV